MKARENAPKHCFVLREINPTFMLFLFKNNKNFTNFLKKGVKK